MNHVIVWLMNFAEGPAVLSRYPITASEVHDLPRCVKRLDPRVLLRAEVVTPWGPVAVFSAHTSRDDCQLGHVGELARARAASGPTVLMGDLNTAERAAALQALTNGGGFVDVFRVTNPDAPGLTTWQRVRSETPTVFRRVDYVLMAGVRKRRRRRLREPRGPQHAGTSAGREPLVAVGPLRGAGRPRRLWYKVRAMKKSKKATVKKAAAKAAPKKSPKPAATAKTARPSAPAPAKKPAPAAAPAKPSGGTYTPQPITGMGWGPFRYP